MWRDTRRYLLYIVSLDCAEDAAMFLSSSMSARQCLGFFKLFRPALPRDFMTLCDDWLIVPYLLEGITCAVDIPSV